MSLKTNFRISVKHLYFYSFVILVGIFIAALFIRFAPAELCEQFSSKFETYFSFSGLNTTLMLILKEYFWLLIIMMLAYIPYGRAAVIALILYKGFSVGIISSLACQNYGGEGIKYILFIVLPSYLLYFISLCLAAQISFEVAGNLPQSGRHCKPIDTDRKAYLFCFIITALGGLIESYYTPWVFDLLF